MLPMVLPPLPLQQLATKTLADSMPYPAFQDDERVLDWQGLSARTVVLVVLRNGRVVAPSVPLDHCKQKGTIFLEFSYFFIFLNLVIFVCIVLV